MGVLEQAARFAHDHGRTVTSGGSSGSYYRLGAGPVIVWLTGGTRRATLGCARRGARSSDHTVVTVDYPPMRTIDEFVDALDAIRAAEGVERCVLVGNS